MYSRRAGNRGQDCAEGFAGQSAVQETRAETVITAKTAGASRQPHLVQFGSLNSSRIDTVLEPNAGAGRIGLGE